MELGFLHIHRFGMDINWSICLGANFHPSKKKKQQLKKESDNTRRDKTDQDPRGLFSQITRSDSVWTAAVEPL